MNGANVNRPRRIVASRLGCLAAPALLAIVGCAKPTTSQLTEPPPAPSGSAAAATTDPPSASFATESPADPRVVRCGVDDRPKNVLGLLDEPPTAPDARSPFLALGFSTPLEAVAQKIMMRKPRPPSTRTVGLALPRSSAFFEGASSNGVALEGPAKTAAVGKRFDVSACIGESSLAKGTVVIQLRVASTGAPVVTALLDRNPAALQRAS